MSSSSLAKASFREPWGREEVIVVVEAIVAMVWVGGWARLRLGVVVVKVRLYLR